MTRTLVLLILAIPLRAGPVDDCLEHRKMSRAAEARRCFVQLQGSPDPYLRAEGYWGLENWEAAKNQFELALKREPKNPLIPVRYGRLLLERFNQEQALELFEQALGLKEDYPPALLGIALIAGEHFDRKSADYAEKALKQDPKYLEAQEVLARFTLEDADPARARKEADAALAISPNALDAMAIHAAADEIQDVAGSGWLAKMLERSPKYGRGQMIIARLLVLNRRYDDAIKHYREAVKLDPDLYAARSELAVNLMRLGQSAEARQLFDECWENGYRNAATANSLKLLDSYKNFVTFKTPRGSMLLHKKEAGVLRPYVEAEIERAISTYEKKYGYKLPGPVGVEMYPDHADFEVRAIGLPGLGALGVTFGTSVAMDSPSGRPPGSFHWGSTLWHELSHVFVLSATNSRVPRWFTEGLAVHEETLVSPEWGDRLHPSVVRAMKDKKLLPVSTLDRGFMRPSYPGQVIVSYFQGGRICDYIAGRWGEGKLNEMIRAFAKVRPTPEVIESALGMKAEQFDREFLAWLEQQHASILLHFDDWTARYKSLAAAAKEKNFEKVVELAPQLLEWYPEYVEAGSPYELLASAYTELKNKPQALETLRKYAKAGGRSPATLKKLAAMEEEAGHKREAAAALARLNYIFPVNDEELHSKLGGVYVELGSWKEAVKEYRALVASKPLDPASAYYNLARAYHASGQREEAQDSLLQALEAAPGYRPAQKMLLELNRTSTKKEN